MKTATQPQTYNDLEQLRKRLDAWRKSNKPRTRIPKNLWDAAIRAAAECGINRTAKALRLDYYSLKKRLTASAEDSSPAFIELLPSATNSVSEYAIELEASDGTKMHIQVKGPEMPDAITLSRELWSIKR